MGLYIYICTYIEITRRKPQTEQQCTTLQHTAPHCTTLCCTCTEQLPYPRWHTASHCNALQHTTWHCNTLWCACREQWPHPSLHTATHFNTLQHTATYCVVPVEHNYPTLLDRRKTPPVEGEQGCNGVGINFLIGTTWGRERGRKQEWGRVCLCMFMWEIKIERDSEEGCKGVGMGFL